MKQEVKSMRIMSGLDYYQKLHQVVQECVTEAKAHPFETYIFIAEDPHMMEKYFFQYTHYLVNIEIMSWQQFLQKQQTLYHLTNHSILTQTQYTYNLYHILQNHHFHCFTSQHPFSLIQKFIPFIKEMNLSMMENNYDSDQPKLQDFHKIYHLLLKSLDQYTHLTLESLFDQCSFDLRHDHIYIEADHLYQQKRQDIIQRLDQHNELTLLYTYQNDDRLFNMPYHHLCQNTIHINHTNDLLDQVFSQEVSLCPSYQNTYTFVAPTPYHEVKRVVYTIYQQVVDQHLRFQDFMIVYPDQTYHQLLIEVLNELSIPHHLPMISSCQYDISYQMILQTIEKNHIQQLNHIIDFIDVEKMDTAYLHYLESLKEYDTSMCVDDIKEFFQTTYIFNHQEKQDNQDYVHVCSLQDAKSDTKRHVFFLGMNETIFPRDIKDTQLLLDEDIIYLRDNNQYAPLTTLELRGIQENEIIKALQVPHHSLTISYCQGTLSGETRIPSTLYHQLQQMLPFKPLPQNEYVALDDYYVKGGQLPHKETINSHIHHYQETKHQPVSLSKETVSRLYSPTLSVSQIETYNQCPFSYFIQYGLGLYPIQNAELQSHEIGSLVHDVLSKNIHLDKNIDNLVDDYIQKNEILQNKISQSYINHYFIQQLKKDLVLTLEVLHQMMETSSFKVQSLEKNIFDTIQGIQFKGIVDRIDIYDHYVSIIDYKSSAKDIDLNLAMQGFNIQMLLYLKVVTKYYHKDPAAVLYFNTKKKILSGKNSLHDPICKEDIQALYRYGGYVIDDNQEVIHALDPHMQRKSNIIPLSYVKSKNTYSGHLLTSKQFDRLFAEIENHIVELYQHMIQGDISIQPQGSDQPTIHTKVNPCRFCSYHSICQFDIFYHEYKLVNFYDVEKKLGGEEDAV